MDMFHCPVQIEDPLESLLSLQSLYKSSGKHCSWHSLGEILAQQFCSPNLSYQWKPYEKWCKKNLDKSVDKSSHWVITFELLPMLLRSLVSRKGLSNRINSVWVDARPSCMSSPWWRLGCRTSDWSDRLITRGFETLSCSWMKVSYWSWHLEVLTSYNFIESRSQNCNLCSVMSWNVWELFSQLQLLVSVWGDDMAFCANSFLGKFTATRSEFGVRSSDAFHVHHDGHGYFGICRLRPAKLLFSESQFRRDHLWNRTGDK